MNGHARSRRAKIKIHMRRKWVSRKNLEVCFRTLEKKRKQVVWPPVYAIVSGVYDSDSQPPNAPMFTGGLQKQPKVACWCICRCCNCNSKGIFPKAPPRCSSHKYHGALCSFLPREESWNMNKEVGAAAYFTKPDGRQHFKPGWICWAKAYHFK